MCQLSKIPLVHQNPSNKLQQIILWFLSQCDKMSLRVQAVVFLQTSLLLVATRTVEILLLTDQQHVFMHLLAARVPAPCGNLGSSFLEVSGVIGRTRRQLPMLTWPSRHKYCTIVVRFPFICEKDCIFVRFVLDLTFFILVRAYALQNGRKQHDLIHTVKNNTLTFHILYL